MACAPVQVNEELRAPLAEARKDLLDFGLRNPLLNYRLLKARGLEVSGLAPAEVFRALVAEGAELSFLGVEEMLRTGSPLVLDGRAKDTSRSLARTVQGRKRPTEEPVEDWLRQKELPTGIPEKELEKRLLATYYAAKSSIEEQGVNT